MQFTMCNNTQNDVTNLDTFQTNKDQFLGRIIAEAATLIAKGAHLKKEENVEEEEDPQPTPVEEDEEGVKPQKV